VEGKSRSSEEEPRNSGMKNAEIQMRKSSLRNLGGAQVENGLAIPQIDFSPARTSTGQNSPM